MNMFFIKLTNISEGQNCMTLDKPMTSLSTCHQGILPWMAILLNLVKSLPPDTSKLCITFGYVVMLLLVLRLMVFRWVIPANGETLLRLRFVSEELGQFDQTLNFEIVGTRRRYQLYCRGTCAFPTISREPR